MNATTKAPAAAVWTLLIDGRSWTTWAGGLDELMEDRSSGLDPHGRDTVGTVRAFRSGKAVAGERLTELIENRRMAYEGTFNPVLRDYHAVIELEPNSAGRTTISWRGTWRARPGFGWLMPFVLPGIMQRMANDLAAYAGDAGDAGRSPRG